jgi:hypothetical protein
LIHPAESTHERDTFLVRLAMSSRIEFSDATFIGFEVVDGVSGSVQQKDPASRMERIHYPDCRVSIE